MKNIVGLILCVVFYSSSAQSPWVRDYKKNYVQAGLNTIPTYNRVFQGNQSNVIPINGSITELGAQVYAEYGLGKNFEVQGSIPVKYMSSKLTDVSINREEGAILGLGNVEASVKYQIMKAPFLLTTQLMVGLPTIKSDGATALRTGYNTAYLVPTISTGNGSDKWYYYLYAGVGVYGNNYSDDVRFGIEYGRKFFSKLWVIGTFNIRESFKNSVQSISAFDETYLFVNNQYYNSLALKISYELNEQVGLNGSVNLISLRANNLPFQRPFALSIYRKI